MAITGRTSMSDEKFVEAFSTVERYLKDHPFITNRELRSLTGLNYDQSIKFFNIAISRCLLQRQGKAGGTKYMSVE